MHQWGVQGGMRGVPVRVERFLAVVGHQGSRFHFAPMHISHGGFKIQAKYNGHAGPYGLDEETVKVLHDRKNCKGLKLIGQRRPLQSLELIRAHITG